MARVEIASQSWGYLEQAGVPLTNTAATLKNLDGSNATHWSAVTGGTSTTASMTSDTIGVLAGRFVEGGTYTLTVQSTTRRVEAVSGSVETSVRFHVNSYLAFTDPVQEAINACSAVGGGRVTVPEGTWSRSTAAMVPNFVEVEGYGQSTLIRCTGNNYAFSFAPGHRSRIANLMIDAASVQTSGGALDYTNAGSNTRCERLYFGSNLHTSVNLTPNTTSTVHLFDRVRWNGVTGCNTAFKIGDGVNLVTDVSLRGIKGTASATADMVTWLDAARNVDTLTLDDVLFIKGTTGCLLGSRGTTGAVTGLEADQVVIDQMTGRGIDSVVVQDVTFSPTCMIQTCGSATLAGLHARTGTVLLRYAGTIRQCGGDGVLIDDGSSWVRIVQAEVYDNNTTNTANLSNVRVAAGADFWEVSDCLLGNNVALSTGRAKHGIRIEAGNSNQFLIGVNRHHRNETSPISDGSTGQIKVIMPQLAADAAGTAQVPVDTVLTGTVYVRDTAADERIRLSNSGILNVFGLFDANTPVDIRGTAGQSGPLAKFSRASTLKSEINSQGEFVSDDATKGVVLKDTQGTPHYWRVTVSNTGVLTTADLGVTRPD